MRRSLQMLLLLPGLFGAAAALAQPDRDSLLEAWEAFMVSLPATASFEKTGDGAYRLEDTELPYSGKVRIVAAIVRPPDDGGIVAEFTHFGMVEFELPDLPPERLGSQSFYYWLGDRQTLHYSNTEQAWLDPRAYQRSIAETYGGGLSLGGFSFMANYGIWVLLITLIVFVFIVASRQSRKARKLMDDSAAINEQARQNLDRSEKMQDRVLAIARESRDLQAENNELLKQVLETLRS